jgi:hypothetical protein
MKKLCASHNEEKGELTPSHNEGRLRPHIMEEEGCPIFHNDILH